MCYETGTTNRNMQKCKVASTAASCIPIKLGKFAVPHRRDGNPPLICVVSHKDERGFPIVEPI